MRSWRHCRGLCQRCQGLAGAQTLVGRTHAPQPAPAGCRMPVQQPPCSEQGTRPLCQVLCPERPRPAHEPVQAGVSPAPLGQQEAQCSSAPVPRRTVPVYRPRSRWLVFLLCAFLPSGSPTGFQTEAHLGRSGRP